MINVNDRPSFNPCFIGILSVRTCPFGGLVRCRLVSILVLLEFCLWDGRKTRKMRQATFQSLFYWNSVCENANVRQKKNVKGFNPCFIGILSVRIVTRSLIFPIASFNPCFIGILSVRQKFIGINVLRITFQSLFYWNSVCELDMRPLKHKVSEFQSLFYWNSVCEYFNNADDSR